jgi:hypothetical protein
MMSMKPMISGSGVEFPHEENYCGLQVRIVLLEPADLGFQRLDLGMLAAADTSTDPTIDLGLHHPAAHET